MLCTFRQLCEKMVVRTFTFVVCEALAKETQVRSSQLKYQTECEFNTCTARKCRMLFCNKCASSHFLLVWTQIQVSCWAVNDACTSIDYNAVTSSIYLYIDVHSSCSALICSWCWIGCPHQLACCVWKQLSFDSPSSCAFWCQARFVLSTTAVAFH